jgi:hypothetical protein
VQHDFSLEKGAQGIRLVLTVTGTSSTGTALFDDAFLTNGRESNELFDNPHMTDHTQGWLLYWGDHVEHVENAGHLTPGGAIRTEGDAPRTGSRGAFTGVRSLCIDVTDRGPLDQFQVAASAKPDSTAQAPEMGIHVDYHSDTNCTAMIGRSLFFGEANPGVWSRMDGTFIPPRGTKGIIVLVRSSGLADGGGATFDDISLSLTPAVRQLWLIGVGDIEGQKILPFDLQYTRGGGFGGNFDAAEIALEGLVNLEFEFDGCNSGRIRYQGEGLEGGYPVYRLADNVAVKDCEERGFENMAGDTQWMSGYWFGGPETDGEGFAIDVLAGGQRAIVTWYTYKPKWGVDAPR